MPKVRLNKEMREDLTDFLVENLPNLCKKENTKREKAYQKARDLVLKDRLKKYPANGMAVLEKYKQTRSESTIVGVDPAGRQVEMSLRAEDAPRKPDDYSTTVHPFRAGTATAIDDYGLADNEYKEAVRTKRADYDALIAAFRYVEDVIEVWPASKSVLDDYLAAAGRNLPVALPESALARIKKQNLGA